MHISFKKFSNTKLSKRKIVKITWLDSCGIDGIWEDMKELQSLAPSVICSVGYLCETNKEYITIAQSFNKDQVGRRFSIPTGCIKGIKILR